MYQIQTITRLAVLASALLIAVTALYGCLSFWVITMEWRAQAGNFGFQESGEGAAFDRLAQPLAWALIALVILAYVAGAVWVYRASANARSMDPAPECIAPGWAVA